MTNFFTYFRSHLKSRIRPIIYILVTALVVTLLIGVQNQPTTSYDSQMNQSCQDYKSTLNTSVVFMCILTYVLPVMEFSFFKKRINLDCVYSLPISRVAMGTVHYLTGLFILFGTFTASYLLNFALLLSRGEGWFDFAPMIVHYLLCLLFGFAMYSIMVFVFNEANTKGDGIWFIVLYTFVFLLTVCAICRLITVRMKINGINLIPWGIIVNLTNHYEYLVEIDRASKATFWQNPANVIIFVFFVLLGIASAVGFFLTFGKRRMEKTEEISNSYFGFRTLIPLYAVSGMIYFNASDIVICWVIIELIAIIGYTIYRRGFRYKKSDIITLCALLLFLFI